MAKSKAKAQGYRHASAKRARAPSEEDRQIMRDEDVQSVAYYPPESAETGAPRLSWQRGDALEQPTAASPLYIQERIHPSDFVRGLTKQRTDNAQQSLFGEFNNLPEDAKYKWYQHQGNWSNRLIRGPSLEVMASLIVKDDLAGKVQCIYFDPPYGISFKSLYQQSTRSKNEDKRDKWSECGAARRVQGQLRERRAFVPRLHPPYRVPRTRVVDRQRQLLPTNIARKRTPIGVGTRRGVRSQRTVRQQSCSRRPEVQRCETTAPQK